MALGELKNGMGPDAYAIYQQAVASAMERVHPVGSLYMSASPTSPAELFGGTWEQIKDKFILAAGDTYAAGSTGGSQTHTHNVSGNAAIGSEYDTIAYKCSGDILSSKFTSDTYSYTHNVDIAFKSGNNHYSSLKCALVVGAADAQSNMPPYTAMYVWKRIV